MNVSEIVTEKILTTLEAGGLDRWRKTWKPWLAANGVSQRPYTGINVLLTALAPFASPYFFTFGQVQQLGGHVRKGAKGTLVVFMKPCEKADPDTGEVETVQVMRYYTVFNLEQVEALPEPVQAKYAQTPEPVEVVPFLRDLPDPKPAFAVGEPMYSLAQDTVFMPPQESFDGAEDYLATLAHEIAHATGHPTRLGRFEAGTLTGEAYAQEELTAELAAAMLCASAGRAYDFRNSARYLHFWLQAMKANPRYILRVSRAAQQACDFVLRKTPVEREVTA